MKKNILIAYSAVEQAEKEIKGGFRHTSHIVMTVLLLLLMNYRFTENAFHEISGLIFAVFILLHSLVNRRWYASILKGKWNCKRAILSAINLVLVLTMITAVVTGALISLTVFAPLDIRSTSLLARELHQGAAYASFILSAIHLGLHGDRFAAKLKIGSQVVGFVWAKRLGAIAIAAYGIDASFANHIGEKILMRHVFASNAALSLWEGLLAYCSIMGCYMGITYYLMRWGKDKKYKIDYSQLGEGEK